MTKIIAPSILSADFNALGQDIDMINQSEAGWFHVDVMDGVFVPNISFGFPVMKGLQKRANKPLDVHLMIVQPERYIQQFADAGADVLTVHLEASTHLHRTLQEIKAAGMKAGVALNPHTSIYALMDVLEDIDLVCLMSVNPGFGGQKFINSSIDKIKSIRNLVGDRNIKIQVDGGINDKTSSKVIEAGADVLVAGSAIFKGTGLENYKKNIDVLRSKS